MNNQSSEFWEGAAAEAAGIAAYDNPYPEGSRACKDWFSGWYWSRGLN